MVTTIVFIIVISIVLKSFYREYEEKRGSIKNRKEYKHNLDLIRLDAYQVREYIFNRGDFNYEVMDNLNQIEILAKSMEEDLK